MLDISKIQKVYSGRFGCMCGCRGKHSYTEGQEEGYDDQVNERSVRIIAGKVLRNPNRKVDRDHVYVEDRARNKMQVVYFKESQETYNPFDTVNS